MIKRSRTWLIPTIALCALVAGIAVTKTVEAKTWDNRADGYGYFDNGRPYNSPYTGKYKGLMSAPNYIDSTIEPAIPHTMNSPEEYYQYMYQKYHHAGSNKEYSRAYGTYQGLDWNEKDRTGISFMVNALLGRNGDQARRVPSDADWQELHDRLTQPGISLVILNRADASSYRGKDSYYQVDRNDVGNTPTVDDGGIAFALLYNGNVKWVVLYKCGNVLGDWDGLPEIKKASQWLVSTGVSADRATAEVGDTITWRHTVTQQGPDATDQAVDYGYRNSENIAGIADSGSFTAGTGANSVRTFDTTYKVQLGDSGKQICRQTFANPSATGQGWVLSAVACVTINVYYNYELRPTITFSDGGTGTAVEVGSAGTALTYNTKNVGITNSRPTVWQLTRCVYAPGTAPASQTTFSDSTQSAAQLFGGNCTATGQPGGTQVFAPGDAGGGLTDESTGAAVGTHVCYILSVSPPSSSLGGTRYSAPACIAYVKFPKIQALGADARATIVRTHAPTIIGGKTFGSWAQFGLFGFGTVTGMASAGSLNGGATNNDPVAQRALTFANNSPSLGGFSAAPTANSYFDVYDAQAVAGPNTAGGPVDPGTKSVTKVTGTLRITSNISYPDTYTSIAQIPRVIYVVDGDIVVDQGVTRIDAWLISNGTLYTCDQFTNPAVQKLKVDGACSKQLVFNGPVNVAGTVLGRTYGASATGGSAGDPAEVFNLAPSNYLSNYSTSISQSNIQTVYEKEMPPRW